MTHEVWLNGFIAGSIIAGFVFLFFIIGFVCTFGDGDDNKFCARMAIAALLLGPLLAVIWPITAALVILGLFGVLVYGAIRGF